MLRRDNCFSLFSLDVFCDNTVGTATLLGKQKAGPAPGEQEPSSTGKVPAPAPFPPWKREAATGGIWLVLDDPPTAADNDLINRQPCQIRPQIGWLCARSWIRETLFDVIRAQLGYMLCSVAQPRAGNQEVNLPGLGALGTPGTSGHPLPWLELQKRW